MYQAAYVLMILFYFRVKTAVIFLWILSPTVSECLSSKLNPPKLTYAMSEEIKQQCCRIEFAFAHLILRLWVGMRLFMAGVDKFRAKGSLDLAKENLEKNLLPIMDLMGNNAIFLPKALIAPYFYALTYGLLIFGALVIVGLFTRLSLLAGGLIFVSLAFGLLALPDDSQGVMRGIEVAITAFALVTARGNQLSVDGLFGCFFRKKAE